MKTKIKKSSAKKWKLLNALADSLWSSMTTNPSIDLLRDYPGRYDRRRSAGGVKPLDV